MVEACYPCVRVRQNAKAKDLLLFSAPAEEIEAWIGIPQRLTLGDEAETAGFQRTVSPSREAALKTFFSDDRNVIQNPLLAAIRPAPAASVIFEPLPENPNLGKLRIIYDDFCNASLYQLFRQVRSYLESRVQELANRPLPTELIAHLQARLHPTLYDEKVGAADLEADEDAASTTEDSSDEQVEPAEEALFDESQISDFWDQLRAREEIASKLPQTQLGDALLGFDKETLRSYLRPIILVDGQHRLRGAVLASREKVDQSETAQRMILDGTSPVETRRRLSPELGRSLPITLLMDDSPAEHVFQYVIVNQKATAVPKALLGTIISTSLAADELRDIAARLEDAKVPLEGSRIISILTRATDSPFYGKVAKGLENEGQKLPWSVLGSLADSFRFLQDARYYHDTTDHARRWRDRHLAQSPIVEEWAARGFDSALLYWQDLNGPWIEVFKLFWTATRNKLGTSADDKAANTWGNARESNLFNKPSLHILTADFFAFLNESRTKIQSFDHVNTLVDEWLAYVSPKYFARSWNLAGVKKDSVGTRRQWSKLWVDHRQVGGNPPAPREFSKLYKS